MQAGACEKARVINLTQLNPELKLILKHLRAGVQNAAAGVPGHAGRVCQPIRGLPAGDGRRSRHSRRQAPGAWLFQNRALPHFTSTP